MRVISGKSGGAVQQNDDSQNDDVTLSAGKYGIEVVL